LNSINKKSKNQYVDDSSADDDNVEYLKQAV